MMYKVGDRVEYRTYDDSTRIVTVEKKDTHKGRPCFDGFSVEHGPVWGYDSQIIRVIPS